MAVKITLVVAVTILMAAPLLAASCPTYPLAVPLPAEGTPRNLIMAAVEDAKAMLSKVVSSNKYPGMVASIVYDQELLWSGGFGSRNIFVPDSPPPSGVDLVMPGSITKVFTDLMLMKLRDDGVVGLNDAVTDYMPVQVKDPYNTKRPITLRQLASHTSGLPRETPCAANCTEAEVLANLAKQWLILPQYQRGHYSNLGVSLLGRALGHALDAVYETWVEDNILAPLGMTNATFTFNATTESRLAMGVVDGKPATDYISPTIPWDSPCGYIYASANGMGELMKMIFRDNATVADGPNQIIDSATIREWMEPVIPFRGGQGAFGTPWEYNYTMDRWVLNKAGEVPGWTSQIAVVPELKLGVFTSVLNNEVADDTIYTWSMLESLVPAVTEALDMLAPTPSPPKNMDMYFGSFGSAVLGNLTVTLYNQSLVLAGDGSLLGSLSVFPFEAGVLRLHLYGTEETACRWVDDGPNYELLYFSDPSPDGYFTSLFFMGTAFPRII